MEFNSGFKGLTSLLTIRPVAESYIIFIVVFERVAVSKQAYDPVDMKTLYGKNTHRP